jgi:uncharacterized protein (TIGR04222 family)
MNPFDWSGPAFLAFYAALAAAVIAWCWLKTRAGGAPARMPPLTEMTADPYRIACLREGVEETIRVAIFNLVDRGLLAWDGSFLSATRKEGAELLRRPLDRKIVQACGGPTLPARLLRDPAIRQLSAQYETELADRGLVAGEAQKRAHLALMVFAVALLAGVALTKILVALSRGRMNVLFLILLGALACGLAIWVCRRRITAAGRELLQKLQVLLARLQARVAQLAAGGATNEALLLAAAFGLYTLPSAAYPFVEKLFPRPQKSSDDSGSWFDFSCSSGCGGSCGGGCGGCGG